MNRGSNASRSVPYVLTALACLASTQAPAGAQQNAPTSYEVTETNINSPVINAENVGPVRMARFSLVKGKVNTRPTNKMDWAPAYINQPIRQGEQVYVPANSRVEIQFDDGSVVRLGGGAFITMQTLYSDDQGEFTEVKLNDGLSDWRLKNKNSVYQIDTPCCSVKAAGPAKFRVGARKDCEVSARLGNCTVENKTGQTNLTPGKYVRVSSTDDPMQMLPAPPDDEWENWNADRDHVFDDGSPISRRYLPPNIDLVANDLDSYGSWNNEPTYGNVWYPRVTDSSWRPYHNGRWVWADPFGWTWVGAEPWGWAPYHYGTWVHSRRGWGWCPGPAHQYWSPAAVSFSSYNGDVAWAPLAPEEVRYPSRLAIGFSGGDWALSFSIGGCGTYYPGPNGICYSRAWNNVYINRATYVTNYRGYGGRPLYSANYNTYMRPGAWTPRNARFGGGSMIAANRFGGSNQYNFVARNNINVFQRGRPVGVPGKGYAPALGPSHVRPTLASLTPGRTFNRNGGPSAALASRPLFRSGIAPKVAAHAPNFGNRFVTRAAGQPNAAARPGFNAANRPGMAGRPGFNTTNRPGVAARPGFNNANKTGFANTGNRPGARNFGKAGAPMNANTRVPANVQNARKALATGSQRNPAANARQNIVRHTPAGNTKTLQPNNRARSSFGNGRAANVAKTNTARPQTRTAQANTKGRQPGSFQHAATNHSNGTARRTTPTRTNNFALHNTRPYNQQAQTHRNNSSFQRNGFSNSTHAQPRNFNQQRSFNQPHNFNQQRSFNQPRNFDGGGGSRPMQRSQPWMSQGGGFNRGGGGGNHGGNFNRGGAPPMQRSQPAAPRGGGNPGGGGNFNRGGGGGNHRGR